MALFQKVRPCISGIMIIVLAIYDFMRSFDSKNT